MKYDTTCRPDINLIVAFNKEGAADVAAAPLENEDYGSIRS
jgi:hypothetical protein